MDGDGGHAEKFEMTPLKEKECISEPIIQDSPRKSPRKSHDGVFSNLSAKPELMVLPKTVTDTPPAYEGHFAESRFFSLLNPSRESISDMLIGDSELGVHFELHNINII